MIAIIIIGSAVNGNDDDTADANKKESKPAVTEPVKDTTAEDTTAQDNVPADYKSALEKAHSYAETMYMSKNAIYDQLTSASGEKFSAEAAKYAIDTLDFEIDWQANAVIKAQSYSDTMYLSKKGLYEQLTSASGEKFTADEAQYAIDNVIADFNNNALIKAKSYQESMSMSPAAIKEQLTSASGEKFTQAEADYAINNLNK